MAIANFGAQFRFGAKDKVSKSFRDMDKSAKRFGNAAAKAFRKASKGASGFRSVTKGILAAGAISRGLGLVTQGLRSVTTEFISFDDSITAASAKFIDVNLATEAGRRSMDKLRAAARKTGAETEFNATQAASALDFLAMAGFNSEQAISSLPGVVDLATAGNLDLATATDIASDSLGAFGLMTKDAAQLQKNLTRVNDVFAKTATTANLTVEQLFETVKQGGPDFVNAGQSIETFAALAGTMAGSGIKAEKAGVQLRNAIVNLSATTPAADMALKKLGVTVEDDKGKFRDAIDIFEDLQKGLKGVKSDTERTALVTAIFGKRSSGLKVLLSTNIDKLRKYRKTLEESSGAALVMAEIMRQSLGNQIKTLSSAATELGFKIFEAFETQGAGAIQAMTKAIREFNPEPIIFGIGMAVDMFKNLWAIIRPLKTFLGILIGVWIAYATVMKIVAAAQTIVALTNPVTAIIIGVVALIALLAALVKNWEKVKQSFGSFLFGDQGAGQVGIESGGLFGEAEESPRVAPNEAEAQARAEGEFRGRLDIAGAPKGSTVTSENTGAAAIDMALLDG